MNEDAETSFRDLRYFNLVAELHHMGKAAEQLGRGQPTLTKAIQRLESAVGGQLFVRHSKGMTLTPVGQALFRRTRELRNNVADTIEEAKRLAQGSLGRVRVGCSPVAAEQILPRACAEMNRLHPGISLEVTVAQSDALCRALEENRLDVLVSPAQEVASPTRSEVIVQDQVVVVARVGHPVLMARNLKMTDLCAYPWALPPRAVPTRIWLDERFARLGLTLPEVRIEANSLPLLRRVLTESDLLTFIPRGCLSAASWLDEVPVSELQMTRCLTVMWRTDTYQSAAANRFLDVVRRAAMPEGRDR